LTKSLVGEACPLHCRTRSSAGILSFFSKRILRAHVPPGPFRGRDGIPLKPARPLWTRTGSGLLSTHR
jgi:hypothetical protein